MYERIKKVLAILMAQLNNKGPLIDPGLCRCCGSIKKCRLLNVEYEYSGQKEVYSDMFVDCFGLMLSHLDGDDKERLICATCVTRLREASSFRQQVLQCEDLLLQSKIHVHSQDGEMDKDIKVEVTIKSEASSSDLHNDVTYNDEHIDDIDEDDLALSTIIESSKKTREKKRLQDNDIGTETSEQKMMIEIKRTRDKLKRLDTTEEPLPYIPPIVPKAETIYRIGTFQKNLKALKNAATIVEFSYVCPFYTPYSSDYYCVYCRDKFSDPDKFREHTITHDPKKYQDFAIRKKFPQIDIFRIDCRLCDERIDDLELFKTHVKTVHRKYIYQNVPDGFLKFKLTKKNLTCTECNASFDFFLSLKKHMAEHFGSCICDVCGAHFFEENMLVVHQKTHQKEIESFACDKCGKCFKSKYTRHLHISKIHTKEPVYQCTKCDQSFFTKAIRIKHMREIHDEIRKFVCGQCERVYDNRRSLTEHYRKCHAKFFKHQCNICDRRFYMPCHLKEHMAVHTGERNYRCDQCGKTYPRLKALKFHLKSHNEKKYTCPVCNATFAQKTSLNNHLQKQHQCAVGHYQVYE